jgi:nuclear pore complex protein Nup93
MEILTYTQEQLPQLNFAWVVGRYTADFRAARADAAAEYLILICLNADLPDNRGQVQAGICHEALRELVLETREFATLLGDVRSNGHSTNGLIRERIRLINLTNDDDLINSVTIMAAKKADEAGRTNDAVLLNHLAGQFEAVIAILCRALSEALSVEIGQTPLRLEPLKPRLPTQEQQQVHHDADSSLSLLGTDDPVELTHRVREMYNRNQLWHRDISSASRQTLDILFQLNRVKPIIEAQQYTQALDVSCSPFSSCIIRDTNPYQRSSEAYTSFLSILTAALRISAPTPTTSHNMPPRLHAISGVYCSGLLDVVRNIVRYYSMAPMKIRIGKRWLRIWPRRRRTSWSLPV